MPMQAKIKADENFVLVQYSNFFTVVNVQNTADGQ